MLAALDGIFAGVVMRVMAVLETSGAWDCLADDHRTGGAASLVFFYCLYAMVYIGTNHLAGDTLKPVYSV